MRIAAAVVTCLLALGMAAGADAEERRTGKRKWSETERGTAGGQRPSTMDRNGLCHRDTGRPINSLDLRQRCDREEFWARFNDQGDGRR